MVLFFINKNIHTLDVSLACSTRFATPCQFSYELLIFSYEHRLFHHLVFSRESLVSNRLTLLPLRGIVVEQYPVRIYVAKDPLFKYLGFNLISSILFFLLSQPSHLSMFHLYVVVSIALGIARN